MKTPNIRPTTPITQDTTASVESSSMVYLGIDYHKHDSVYCALAESGERIAHGRIEHRNRSEFMELVKRWPKVKVAFEATMNYPACGRLSG